MCLQLCQLVSQFVVVVVVAPVVAVVASVGVVAVAALVAASACGMFLSSGQLLGLVNVLQLYLVRLQAAIHCAKLRSKFRTNWQP